MSTAVITVDGTDITDLVEFTTAKFVATVNGVAGAATFRVKDTDHVLSFPTGKEVTLDIDGVRSWGGYVMQAKRVFPLPVTDLAVTPDFYWELVCSDYNILLIKRIVYDHANPEKVYITAPFAHRCSDQRPYDWAPDTHDDVIIDYVLNNYTDLAADGVDLSDINFVGVPSPDLCGAYSTTDSIVDFLNSADFRFLGGLFFIGSDFAFHYVDDETISAPFPLSDVPAGGTVNYRDFEIFRNGADLANEAYVWGTGLGSNHWVVGHAIDATSVTDHHLWQWADVTTTLIHQASVDLRADTMVNGSPSHHRGHKDDAISVTCTIFVPGFTAGMVVDWTSEIYGYSDNLPIRRCTITFPTKTDPRWELQLGFDPDQPWENFETLPPPKSVLPQFPPIGPIINTRAPEVCIVYDDFDRGGASWGTSSSGAVWTSTNGSTDGTLGHLVADYSGDGQSPASASAYLPVTSDDEFDITARLDIDSTNVGALDDQIHLEFRIGENILAVLSDGSAPSTLYLSNRLDNSGNVDSVDLPTNFWQDLGTGNFAFLRMRLKDDVLQGKIWDEADPEPDWMVTVAWFAPLSITLPGRIIEIQNSSAGNPGDIVDVGFDYINVCAASTLPVLTQGLGGEETCEIPRGSGTGPYRLSNSYLTRSLRGYDDGFLIDPAGVLEGSPVGGTFQLVSAPSGTFVMCYTVLDQVSNGPIGGSIGGGIGGGGGSSGGGGGSSGGSGGGGGTGTGTPIPGTDIPDTIDRTGSVDVASDLADYLNGLPPGSTAVIPPGTLYRIESSIDLIGTINLTIEMTGARIEAHGSGFNENYSIFYFHSSSGGNHGARVHGGHIVGNSPTPGDFISGQEGQHGILCDGGSDYEIWGMTCEGMYGDFVEVNSGANGVNAHHNYVPNTGRNGLSVITGTNVQFDDNQLVTMGYMPFDIEPNGPGQPSSYIWIRRNSVDTWTNAFFAADGPSSPNDSDIHHVWVLDNVGINCGINSIVDIIPSGPRRSFFTFQGNRSLISVGGPVFIMAHVDNLNITGNDQPLSSGSLLSITDCPGSVTTPNP